MIKEDYVSFETAKLLKEKGFDDCGTSFLENGNMFPTCIVRRKKHYPAPTLQMAMKWLREEKHYYIQVMLNGWAYGGHTGYFVLIQKTDSDYERMLSDVVDEVFYDTYEEAVEIAIKYVLENLI
ncbi:MAG: hypothetical protein K6A41_04135 [Bacteroidales bacterium]|nr:hypothetical protein [Bacteroidales bacterium]